VARSRRTILHRVDQLLGDGVPPEAPPADHRSSDTPAAGAAPS
jgi:hypothetical protein